MSGWLRCQNAHHVLCYSYSGSQTYEKETWQRFITIAILENLTCLLQNKVAVSKKTNYSSQTCITSFSWQLSLVKQGMNLILPSVRQWGKAWSLSKREVCQAKCRLDLKTRWRCCLLSTQPKINHFKSRDRAAKIGRLLVKWPSDLMSNIR